MNEQDFKLWVIELGHKYRTKGINAIMELSPEEFLLLEEGFNKLLVSEPPTKFDEWVRLRYLFRIVLKYHTDINRGLAILNKQL